MTIIVICISDVSGHLTVIWIFSSLLYKLLKINTDRNLNQCFMLQIWPFSYMPMSLSTKTHDLSRQELYCHPNNTEKKNTAVLRLCQLKGLWHMNSVKCYTPCRMEGKSLCHKTSPWKPVSPRIYSCGRKPQYRGTFANTSSENETLHGGNTDVSCSIFHKTASWLEWLIVIIYFQKVALYLPFL